MVSYSRLEKRGIMAVDEVNGGRDAGHVSENTHTAPYERSHSGVAERQSRIKKGDIKQAQDRTDRQTGSQYDGKRQGSQGRRYCSRRYREQHRQRQATRTVAPSAEGAGGGNPVETNHTMDAPYPPINPP